MNSILSNVRKAVLWGVLISACNIPTIMAQEKKITQTAGRVQLGELAPKFYPDG